MIDEPYAPERNDASQHDMRQSSHQHAKQMCEGALGPVEKRGCIKLKMCAPIFASPAHFAHPVL